jgi:ethanolamine ammonia-lyase small subunit
MNTDLKHLSDKEILNVRMYNIDMDLYMVKRNMERLLKEQRKLLKEKAVTSKEIKAIGELKK